MKERLKELLSKISTMFEIQDDVLSTRNNQSYIVLQIFRKGIYKEFEKVINVRCKDCEYLKNHEHLKYYYCDLICKDYCNSNLKAEIGTYGMEDGQLVLNDIENFYCSEFKNKQNSV